MFLGAARAIGFSRVFIAQAGKLIASVDAIAISCCGSSLNRHEGHVFVLFRRILQLPGGLRKARDAFGKEMPQTAFN